MSIDLISRRHLLMSAASFFPTLRLLRAQQPTFATDVKVVSILATVRNKQGHVVSNLDKDDFTLEEEGRPQTIRYFSRETDLPLTLGLLVDTSGSQRRVLGAERSASSRFLDQVLREEKDLAFLIHFDREIELLQDVTSSRQKLQASLDKLEVPDQQQRPQWGGQGRGGPQGGGGGRGGAGGGRRRGGTSLYDAVLLASDDMMKNQTGRKALILLSDGVDNGSKVPLSSAVESAQRADTLVYSILFKDDDAYGRGGFGGPGMGGRRGGRGGWGGGPGGRSQQDRPDGKKILEQISRETGGSFYEVTKKQPIEQIYKKIEEDLRNQYSLGFTPDHTEASGGFRHIRLTTKNKGLTVQTREGYYGKA